MFLMRVLKAGYNQTGQAVSTVGLCRAAGGGLVGSVGSSLSVQSARVELAQMRVKGWRCQRRLEKFMLRLDRRSCELRTAERAGWTPSWRGGRAGRLVSHVSHVSEPTSARLADQVSHVSGPTRAVERAHVSDPSKSTREPRAKRHVSRASQVSNAHVRQVRKGT
jgi:hypothetical protein